MPTKSDTKKLYLAKTGISSSYSGVDYSHFYVVAKSADDAIQIVESFLEESKIGYSSNRIVRQIELLAEDARYPNCGTILLVCN